MSRPFALCLAASAIIAALNNGDRALVAVALVFAAITVLLVLAVPHRPATTPPTITRVPTAHERQSGSKWLYGLSVRVPFIPFLSIGLFRWRGRKPGKVEGHPA